MVMDSVYRSEESLTSDDIPIEDSAEVTRRRPGRRRADSAEVTRRRPVIQDSAEVTRGRDSAEVTSGSRSAEVTKWRDKCQSAGVTRRPYRLPTVPAPLITPIEPAPVTAAKEPQCIPGHDNPHKDLSGELIPCLRCKEYSIECHGPEIKLGGHCSNCHEDGKRCEFESRASNQNLNAPSSSPNPQSFAINDGIPDPTAWTNNNYRNIPNPQPYTASSARQSYQNPPIIDESHDRETSNRNGGFTDDHSISGGPRTRPWWKRLFSRKDRGAKRKRRSWGRLCHDQGK